MPAPSPVFVSQPQAPRCSRLISTWSACADDGVRPPSLDVDDEADAAGVVLVPRVVETAVGIVHRVLMNQLPAEAKQQLLISSMRPASRRVMWKTDATDSDRALWCDGRTSSEIV